MVIIWLKKKKPIEKNKKKEENNCCPLKYLINISIYNLKIPLIIVLSF
jgi:hypothetical protein